MMTIRKDPGRLLLVNASTDPIVVGLGRLLMGIGALTLAGILSLAWILFNYLRVM